MCVYLLIVILVRLVSFFFTSFDVAMRRSSRLVSFRNCVFSLYRQQQQQQDQPLLPS